MKNRTTRARSACVWPSRFGRRRRWRIDRASRIPDARAGHRVGGDAWPVVAALAAETAALSSRSEADALPPSTPSRRVRELRRYGRRLRHGPARIDGAAIASRRVRNKPACAESWELRSSIGLQRSSNRVGPICPQKWRVALSACFRSGAPRHREACDRVGAYRARCNARASGRRCVFAGRVGSSGDRARSLADRRTTCCTRARQLAREAVHSVGRYARLVPRGRRRSVRPDCLRISRGLSSAARRGAGPDSLRRGGSRAGCAHTTGSGATLS